MGESGFLAVQMAFGSQASSFATRSLQQNSNFHLWKFIQLQVVAGTGVERLIVYNLSSQRLLAQNNLYFLKKIVRFILILKGNLLESKIF